MNELTRITITSMEAAGWCGKRHTDLLRDIRKYVQQLGESKIAFTSLRWSGSAAAGGRNGSGVAAGEARNGFTFEAANNGGTTRNCDSYWSTKP